MMVRHFTFSAVLIGTSLSLTHAYAAEDIQAAEEAQVTKISLADAKAYAIGHNFRIKSLKQEEASAHAAVERRRAAFYPRIGITAGLDGRSSVEDEQVEPLGYVYGSMNLFNGFEDTSMVEIARLEADRVAVQIKREELQIANAVEFQFHNILFQKALRTLKQEAIKANQTHKRLVARVRSAGLASRTDEMEFELKESVLKSELASLEQGFEEARVALKNLLGEDIGGVIEPAGELQHQHVKGRLMDYVSKIKSDSAPVQIATKQQAIANIQSRLWRSKWLPDVDFEVRAGYLPLDERLVEVETQVSFVLTAKMELFSGFDTRWEREELLAKQTAADAALKADILSALTDLETYYRRLKTIEERVDLEQGSEDLTRKYYSSVADEYKRGYKNSADLSAAADRLAEAQERRLKYVFEFLTQRLAMERIVGTPIEVEVVRHDPVLKQNQKKETNDDTQSNP